MHVTTRSVGRSIWLALLAVACGCHALARPPALRPTRCACAPHGPCGGYFSTCWRQWPSECVACPPVMEASESPAPLGPTPAEQPETVLPPAPMPDEMPYAPTPDETPSVPPAAPANEPPPDESRLRPGRDAVSQIDPGARQAADPRSSTDIGPSGRRLTIRAARAEKHSIVSRDIPPEPARPSAPSAVQLSIQPQAQPRTSAFDGDLPAKSSRQSPAQLSIQPQAQPRTSTVDLDLPAKSCRPAGK